MAVRTLAAFVLCAAGQVPAPEAILSRIREAALAYGDRLQNFTCIQTASRAIGPSATGTRWKPLETQEFELAYIDRRKHYRLLKTNGRVKPGYFKGYGQFGSALQRIFDPKAKAEFKWEPDPAGCVFSYRVPQDASTIVITADRDRVQVGHHGMIWANCETGAVTRFVTETDPAEVRRSGRRVPLGFRLEVSCGPATIAGQEFLLPQSAVETALYYKTWTKTEIQFRDYRKYEANSTIRFESEPAAR